MSHTDTRYFDEEQDISPKYLKVVRGKELNIRLAGEICSPRNMLYTAYQQAHGAVREIVNQTITYNEEYSKLREDYCKNDLLARYNGNIIAFEAQRGYGKTQTMMSFSYLLDQLKEIDGMPTRFVVLPMIAPSALEEKQNLLYVVLSRLYCHAEKLVKEKNRDISEHDRIKLSEYLQKCQNGIDGIKKMKLSDDGINDDFSKLQDINDGLALRKHFCRLIEFLACLEDRNNVFFVIQLDDVDSQVRNGYLVLDDIRKYLLVPNLVILISTDGDLLHKSILEEHLQQFKEVKKTYPDTMPGLLSKISKKYIDKLIPPSHMVHLPRIDQFISSSGADLQLFYLKKDRNLDKAFQQNPGNRLDGLDSLLVYDWAKDVDYGLQDFLFMLIYRKTRIVFAKHSNYLHNIIPQSLRGLNQLLFLLSEMEDIPVFDEHSFESEHAYLIKWKNRLSINEVNLSIFLNYFINEWVDVKITKTKLTGRNDREFLRELVKAPKNDRVILAIDYLYNEVFPEENGKMDKPAYKLESLSDYMTRLGEKYKENDVYLLFFSIRMILELESKLLVLRKMKEDVRLRIEKTSSRGGRVQVFDLEPRTVCLPNTFSLDIRKFNNEIDEDPLFDFVTNYSSSSDSSLESTGGHESAPGDRDEPFYNQMKTKIKKKLELSSKKQIDERIKEKLDAAQVSYREIYRVLYNCLIVYLNKDAYLVSFMSFITVLLRLGATFIHNIQAKNDQGEEELYPIEDWETFQKSIYFMQEFAAFIAENWDVQEKIYKYFVDVFETEFSSLLNQVSSDDKTKNNAEKYRDKVDEYVNESFFDAIYHSIDGVLNKYFEKHIRYLCGAFIPEKTDTVKSFLANNGLSTAFRTCKVRYEPLFSGVNFAEDIIEPLFNINVEKEEKKSDTDGSTPKSDNSKPPKSPHSPILVALEGQERQNPNKSPKGKMKKPKPANKDPEVQGKSSNEDQQG